MKNIKIGIRLSLGFGAIIFLLIGISLYSIYKISDLSQMTAKMYKHPYTVTTSVLKIEQNIVKIHRAMKDIALSVDSSVVKKIEIDKQLRLVSKLETKVYDDFKILEERFLGNKQMIENAKDLFIDWTPIREDVVSLMRSGKISEAAKITKEKGAKHIFKLNRTISRLRNFAENKASEFNANSKTVRENAIISIIIILLIAIFLGVFISIYMTRSVTVPLIKGIDFAKQVSEGDLLATVDIEQKDEIGKLANALKNMIERLKGIVSSIIENANNIASASMSLSSVSQEMANGASEQASSTEEVTASMEEMSANIQQNTDNAQKTEEIANKAVNNIKKGSDASIESVNAMKNIADKIFIINEIAFQTNILALNAAVEAARAGEHGKGFAVVATEVRKLAEQSGKAAKQIDEVSTKGVAIAESAGELLAEIVPEIEKTSFLVQEISTSSIEQNGGANQINNAIQQLNQVTQQNAAVAEEMATGSEELSAQSQKLKDIVSFFKIENINIVKKTFNKIENNNIKEDVSTNKGINIKMQPNSDLDNHYENF